MKRKLIAILIANLLAVIISVTAYGDVVQIDASALDGGTESAVLSTDSETGASSMTWFAGIRIYDEPVDEAVIASTGSWSTSSDGTSLTFIDSASDTSVRKGWIYVKGPGSGDGYSWYYFDDEGLMK